jgi:hypothetical protein
MGNMLKIVSRVSVIVLLVLCPTGFGHGTSPKNVRSQINPNFISGGGEYPLLNLLKAAGASGNGGGGWGYVDQTGNPSPAELEGNGYPLYASAAMQSHNGVSVYLNSPSQDERPGNYVVAWTGAGQVQVRETSMSDGPNTNYKLISCTGSSIVGNSVLCDNRGCSTFTGYIAATTLTVVSAPTGAGCSLRQGQPISGVGVTVSKFGIPTTIITSGSSCGGNTCYTVNFPQTVGSSSSPTTFSPGGRYEISVTGELTTKVVGGVGVTGATQWNLNIRKSGTSGAQTNIVGNLAFLYTNDKRDAQDDEAVYWTGEIFGTLFKSKLLQANFGVFRDLDWGQANVSNCTTWATRKPVTYWSYQASEMRNSLYANPGVNATYGYSTNTISFTASISNGFFGAGHDMNVTAASSGTLLPGDKITTAGVLNQTWIVKQTSGTPGGVGHYYVNALGPAQRVASQPMSVTSNDYTLTYGSGPPVDKQTIIVLWPNTPTTDTVTLNLNGTGALPVLNSGGGFNNLGPDAPKAGYYNTVVYDATLNGWIHFGGTQWGASTGLLCSVPPEVSVQLAHEINADPWIVEYALASDPITDWTTQYALYIKNNYPTMKPQFETPNELWNNYPGQISTGYARWKTTIYSLIDSAWSSGDPNGWVGKVGAILGQAVSSVYGGDTSKYEVIIGVGTNQTYPGGQSSRIKSDSYIAQNTSNIPIQSGCAGPGAVQTSCPAPFQQQAGYLTATRIAVYNYWGLGETEGAETGLVGSSANPPIGGTQQEVADAYNYYMGDSSQQAAIMTSYLASTYTANLGSFPYYEKLWAKWNTYATTCQGGSPCPIKGLVAYEGTYSTPMFIDSQGTAFDQVVYITGSNNSTSCALTTTASFTGQISGGNSLQVTGIRAGGNIVYTGADLAGAGVAAGTTIQAKGYATLATTNGNYYITPSQGNVGPVSMTASMNGAVAGMTVTLTSATGGTWSTVVGTDFLVDSGPTKSSIPIKHTNGAAFDCSSLGTLTSGKVTYKGSGLGPAYINVLRKASWIAPGLTAINTDLYRKFIAAGGQSPSQFVVSTPLTGIVGWGSFFFDLYGYFPFGTSTASTISGTTLTLGGTVTGLYEPGQTILCAGCPSGTTIVSGRGRRAGDKLILSQAPTPSISEPEAINSFFVGPSTEWQSIINWNHSFLLKREINPAANDNSRMWLDEVG